MAHATTATVALDGLHIAYATHSYQHSPTASEFGQEAATELGVAAERVFKTLVVAVDDELVIAIVAVSAKLDLKALATVVHGKKAVMADAARAERRTGYVVGGISALGQKTVHRTVIDETIELFDTVFISGGKRGFEIELAPGDLVRATDATLAAISRQSH